MVGLIGWADSILNIQSMNGSDRRIGIKYQIVELIRWADRAPNIQCMNGSDKLIGIEY